MSKTFQSFHYHNYRLWFCSNLLASIATWMQQVAQSWITLTVLTNHSGTAMGVTTALQFLPLLLFGAYGGILADRLNRRLVLQISQAALATTALLLGILVLSDTAQLWHVFAIAFATGIINAMSSPVRQSFVGELVPRSALTNAVGLNSAAFNAARLVGPAASGVIIALIGPGWVFIVNTVILLIPIILMHIMRTSQLRDVAQAPKKKGLMREGLHYVKNRTDIIVIIVVASVVSAFGLNFQITQAVMATQVYGLGAGEYGLLGSIMAIGSLAGALLSARRTAPGVRLVIGSAFLFGVFEGLCALAPSYVTFALALIPTGLFMLTMITAANSAIQLSTDEEIRGRVLSIYLLFYLGSTPIGAPAVGWIAQHLGPRWSLGVGAIASILVAAIAAYWAIRNWHVTLTYTRHRPFIHAYGPRERAQEERELLEHAQAVPTGIDGTELGATHLDAPRLEKLRPTHTKKHRTCNDKKSLSNIGPKDTKPAAINPSGKTIGGEVPSIKKSTNMQLHGS
ncbi:MAG: MFS transporter [Actinomycetaceae bacterium]|nr:MFS transporter [Actinomycetaceae bacterium]